MIFSLFLMIISSIFLTFVLLVVVCEVLAWRCWSLDGYFDRLGALYLRPLRLFPPQSMIYAFWLKHRLVIAHLAYVVWHRSGRPFPTRRVVEVVLSGIIQQGL